MSNWTEVGVALPYGVLACTGKAGVCGLGDTLLGGLPSASDADVVRHDEIDSSRYCFK